MGVGANAAADTRRPRDARRPAPRTPTVRVPRRRFESRPGTRRRIRRRGGCRPARRRRRARRRSAAAGSACASTIFVADAASPRARRAVRRHRRQRVARADSRRGDSYRRPVGACACTSARAVPSMDVHGQAVPALVVTTPRFCAPRTAVCERRASASDAPRASRCGGETRGDHRAVEFELADLLPPDPAGFLPNARAPRHETDEDALFSGAAPPRWRLRHRGTAAPPCGGAAGRGRAIRATESETDPARPRFRRVDRRARARRQSSARGSSPIARSRSRCPARAGGDRARRPKTARAVVEETRPAVHTGIAQASPPMVADAVAPGAIASNARSPTPDRSISDRRWTSRPNPRRRESSNRRRVRPSTSAVVVVFAIFSSSPVLLVPLLLVDDAKQRGALRAEDDEFRRLPLDTTLRRPRRARRRTRVPATRPGTGVPHRHRARRIRAHRENLVAPRRARATRRPRRTFRAAAPSSSRRFARHKNTDARRPRARPRRRTRRRCVSSRGGARAPDARARGRKGPIRDRRRVCQLGAGGSGTSRSSSGRRGRGRGRRRRAAAFSAVGLLRGRGSPAGTDPSRIVGRARGVAARERRRDATQTPSADAVPASSTVSGRLDEDAGARRTPRSSAWRSRGHGREGLIAARGRGLGSLVLAPGRGPSGPNARDVATTRGEPRDAAPLGLVVARRRAASASSARARRRRGVRSGARASAAWRRPSRAPVSSRRRLRASVTSPPGAWRSAASRIDARVARDDRFQRSRSRVAIFAPRRHAMSRRRRAVARLAPSEENATLDTRLRARRRLCAAPRRRRRARTSKSRGSRADERATAPRAPPTTPMPDDRRARIASQTLSRRRRRGPRRGHERATHGVGVAARVLVREPRLATDARRRPRRRREPACRIARRTRRRGDAEFFRATSARVSASKSRATSAPGPTTAIRLPSGDAADAVPRFSLADARRRR